MAVEDAITLSTFVHANVEIDQLSGLLKLYEEVRNPRVGRVREAARKRIHGKPPRDEMQSYKSFLEGHDAVRYAEEKLGEYLEKHGK